VSYNRVSITVVQCGSAAGDNGPVVFLRVGNNENINMLFTPKLLVQHYGLPEGSIMLLNKKGYMDDKTWMLVVKAMAPGIRKMPVIRDHPNGQPF